MTSARLPLLHRALLLLLAAFAVACASEEERFQEHMTRAEAYREAGKFDEAVIELRSALKLQPESALVNERIADLGRETGKFESALFFYREAQRLDPKRVEPLLREFPLVLGTDLERAAEIVRLGVELDPGDPRVQRMRSELALAAGDTQEALAAALSAVELAPDAPASHLVVGIVYQAKLREQQLAGKEPSEEFYRSAIQAFERADAGDSSIQARIERARTLASWAGHEEEAEAAFLAALDRAVELQDQPRRTLIAEEIALRARRLGDSPRERKALESIIAIDPQQISKRERLGLGDPEPRIRQAWSDLAELAERENPGTGPAVLERLIEKQPEDPQVHLLYARFLFERGRSEEALAHLEARAGQGIAPARLLDEATRLSLEKGEIETARRYVQRLGDEQPGEARTLLAKARLALAMQNSAGAVALLGEVNELEESAESQRLLALAQLRLANLAAAQQAVGRSLELEPRSVASLRLQSQIQSQAGDWTAVLQTLRRLRAAGARVGIEDRLLAVRPLYELGQGEKGRALLEEILATDPPPEAAVLAFVRFESQRDPEKAARLIEEALARNPSSMALLPMATAFDLRAGKDEHALERLNRALEARPDLPLLLALRAQVLARADRLEEAERDAQRAFEISPAMPNLLELILAIYQRRGRIDVAIEQLEASESAGLLGAQQRVLLGRLQLGKGNAERAQQLYEAALAEDPELAGAKNDLAFLLARQGRDLDRALELAQEARQKLGEDPQVIDTLGFVMLQRGLAGPAAEQFNLALRLAEESGNAPAHLHYHMGLALRALGQEDAAQQHLERALSISPDFEDAKDARQQLEAARAAAKKSEAPTS